MQRVRSSLFAALILFGPLGHAGAQEEQAEMAEKLGSLGYIGEPQQQETARLAEYTIKGIRFEDPPPVSPFGKSPLNFRSDLAILRQVAADDEIDGLVLEIEGGVDAARTLDLLEGLAAVKAAGKPIVVFAETLDARTLVFAAQADHLAMPPMGMLALQAPSAEVFYMKAMLAKLGLEFEVLHVGAFKTAFEELALDSMSDEQRETIRAVLEELHRQTVRAIADGRGMTVEAVEAAYERFLIRPGEAVELGLIDAELYADEFDRSLSEVFGAASIERVEDYGKPEAPDLDKLLGNPFTMMKNLAKLLDPPAPKLPDGPAIAVVYATGPIMSGKSRIGFDGSVASMGSETIVEALEKTLENDQIKAVVLRVNSPGGSALASDAIWRAVQRVRAKKPVIASMGSVAASGGYWISMGCDRIVAQPSTLTGSIGVVSALPDVSGSMEKLGIEVEVVGYGPRAEDLAILQSGPSEFLKQRLTTWMEAAYDDFTLKASVGRSLEREALEALAHGRVWTGRQAAANGLVDQLGGLEDSLALACELGGGLDAQTTPVAEFPRPRSFFEQFEEMMGVMAATPRPLLAAELAGLPAGWSAVLGAFSEPEFASRDRVQVVLPFFWRLR